MHYVWYSQPASEVHPITPNRPPRNGCIWQGTWNTLSIENHVWGPWCVISGQIIVSWYMHYVWYSQPASEEHPITPNRPLRNGCIWQGTWNTLSIENHVWGPWCVILGQIIVSWYMHYVWYSQPASGEHPITPNRPLRNGCIWQGTWNTLSIENHVWGPWCVILGQIIVSWYMHYVWYSQPASGEHPITPNRPLRNGCIWQQYGTRETH